MINLCRKLLSNDCCDRRFFLKSSLIAASLIFVPSFSFAGKSLPEGKLSLYNTHTGDRLTVKYRNAAGEYDASALRELNWILRCHYSGQAREMDRDVIEFVNLVDKRFGGGNEIQIISGYRCPEYNSKLIHAGGGVARHSLHLTGKAIDIRISGVDLGRLREEAFKLRLGGVGYYRKSNFVHLDSGRFRTW
jgi:uncharacterized protein YcbK (DUF882 family)